MRPLLEGRLTEAEPLIFQSFAQGQRAQAQGAATVFGVQILDLRWKQGRMSELEPAVRGLVEQQSEIPAWRCALALVLAETGQFQLAQDEVDRLAETGFDLPVDLNWLGAIAVLGDACAVIESEQHAQALFDLLSPYAERCVVTGAAVTSLGPASRQLGSLAALIGRWDEAERYFQHSIEMNTRMGARPWVAVTQYWYAWMLARRDGPGDRAKALGLLTEALDAAQEMGMQMVIKRGLTLKLKLQGVDLSNSGNSIDAVASLVYTEKPDLKKHAAPDGTVTIMFSDIEGSTAMADRLGDARFMDVLREHNTIIREQVKSHGGFEVKSEGDGFMVAFQSAGKALACASAIQKALLARNDSAEEPVRVRMGIHAGEVIKEGADFFGRNVIMAARVASQANGGEILTSGVVKALLSGSDVTWGDSRMVALKGLSGEHEIWAVRWSN